MKRIMSYHQLYEAFASKELNSTLSFLTKDDGEILLTKIKEILYLEGIDIPLSKLNSDHVKYLPINKAISYGLDSDRDIIKIWLSKTGHNSDIFLSKIGIPEKPSTNLISNFDRDSIDRRFFDITVAGVKIRYIINSYGIDQLERIPGMPDSRGQIFDYFGYNTRIQKYDFARTYYGYKPNSLYDDFPQYNYLDFGAALRLLNALKMLSLGKEPYEALGIKAHMSYKIEDYIVGDLVTPNALVTGDMIKIQFLNRRIAIAQVFKHPITNSIFLIQSDRGSKTSVIYLTDFFKRESGYMDMELFATKLDRYINMERVKEKENVVNNQKLNIVVNNQKLNIVVKPVDVDKHTSLGKTSIDFNAELVNRNSAWALILDMDKIRESSKGTKSTVEIRRERTTSKIDSTAIMDPIDISNANIERYLNKIADRADYEPVIGVFDCIPRLTHHDYVLYGLYTTNAISYIKDIFNLLEDLLKGRINIANFKMYYKRYMEIARNEYMSLSNRYLTYSTLLNTYKPKPNDKARFEILKSIILQAHDNSKYIAQKLKNTDKDLIGIERSIHITNSIRNIIRGDRYSELFFFINSSDRFEDYMSKEVELKEQSDNFTKLLRSMF